MSAPQPIDLKLIAPDRLTITWDDQQQREYAVRELRDACPCASCREKRSQPPSPGQLPVLAAAETQPLRITAMQPVGRYAYAIHFSDGHDTGLFTLEQLRELGEVV